MPLNRPTHSDRSKYKSQSFPTVLFKYVFKGEEVSNAAYSVALCENILWDNNMRSN